MSREKSAGRKRVLSRRVWLLLGLVAAFFVFSATLVWRSQIEESLKRDNHDLQQEMQDRQDLLERRIRSIEDISARDRIALEDRLLELALARESVKETGSTRPAIVSPFAAEAVAKSVVEIVCIDNEDKETYYTGSGTVVDKEGLIVTNQHNILSADASLIDYCGVGFNVDLQKPPVIDYIAALVALDGRTDLALLRIIEHVRERTDLPAFPAVSLTGAAGAAASLKLGDPLYIGGYPGLGADTFTFTQGVVSGRVGDTLIKTSALIDSGTSGGAVFDSRGRYVGVPTAAAAGELGGSLGYMVGADEVVRFMNDFREGRTGLPDAAAIGDKPSANDF